MGWVMMFFAGAGSGVALDNLFKFPKLATPITAASTIANYDYSRTVDDVKDWVESKKK
jgi:hypothetical protein